MVNSLYPRVTPTWPSLIDEQHEQIRSTVDDLVQRLDGSVSLEEALGQALLSGCAVDTLARAAAFLLSEDLLKLEGEAAGEDDGAYKTQVRFFAAASSFNSSSLAAGGFAAQQSLNTSRVLVVGEGQVPRQVILDLEAASDAAIFRFHNDAGEDTDSGVHGSSLELGTLAQALDYISKQHPDLVIGVGTQAPDSDLITLNECCVESQVPFLPFRTSLLKFEVGPLVIPKETACYMCLLLRERSAAGVEDFSLYDPSAPISHGMNFSIGADLLAMEAIRWLGGLNPPTRSRLWRYEIPTGSTHYSPVLKLPRCPTCGTHRATPDRRLWEE